MLQETSLPTLHRTGSTPSNHNRAVPADGTIYVPSAGTLSRLWQLVSGKREGIDQRAGGSGVKRGWRLASALGLGILLLGLTAHAAPQQEAPFTSQCSGDAFQIDLADVQDANLGQDAEERVEQLRDWIWPVLLARLEATAGLEGLLIGSATQPLIRDDALAHVLDHPVGSTRSGIARDGTVVVMVQVEEPAAMNEAVLEALLEAIDQESLHLGAVPRRVLVYRYDIDQRTHRAELCRLGSFDASWIESQQQGFRRATVRRARDLESFLDGGVDLLSAQCTKKGLEVTGRVRSRVRKAPITVEHVASLYRPAKVQYVPSLQLGASLRGLPAERAEWLTKVAAFLENAGPRELRQAREELDEDTWTMLSQVRAWRELHPQVATEELLLSWLAQRAGDEALGFSLDPKVWHHDAVQAIQDLNHALEHPGKLAMLFYSWGAQSPDTLALVELSQEHNLPAILGPRLTALWTQIRQSGNDHEALGILMRAQQSSGSPEEELLGAVMKLVGEHSMYQCARYDGPLKGTLTGMTMFYTDLLMKLWSIDGFDAAPDGLIPGFESVVAHGLSGAYCTPEESEYPHTRAWLGLREEQYVRERAARVRFAPVATRVFGRGSSLGAGYSKEVEASAEMRRFHRWWNAHYARVAAWEPQYELLNQIMKWSVAVQNAAVANDRHCTAFLDQVPVTRNHHFGQWVESNPDLRWRGPVPLVKQGDEPTECLPLLRSRSYPTCGADAYLSGGVSAASRKTIASKPLVRARVAPELGRLDTMSGVQPAKEADGSLWYDALRRPEGRLMWVEIDPGRRTLQARFGTLQSQRGTHHSYAMDRPVTGVDKSWRLDRGKLVGRDVIDARGARFGVGQLEADDVTRESIRVQVKPDEGARMRAVGDAISKELARGGRMSEIAPALPGVTHAVRVGDDRVLVTLAGVDGGEPMQLLLSSGPGARGPPQGILTLRIGSRTSRRVESAVKVELLTAHQAQALRTGKWAVPLPRIAPLAGGRQPRMAEFQQALAGRDYATAEKMVGSLRPDDARDALGALARARRQAVREGKDTGRIEALQAQVSIRHLRPRGTVRESNVLPADGAVFVVPKAFAAQYAELAALPPGANPATRAGTARRAFHARAISETSTPAELPSEVRIDGVDYTFLRRGAGAIGLVGLAYVIYPCRAEGEPESKHAVECQGRVSARRADEQRRAELRRMACRLGPEQAKKYGVADCRGGGRR
jgi:hypothetical protein